MCQNALEYILVDSICFQFIALDVQMDNVTYTFIEKVAHVATKRCAVNFSNFADSYWNAIGLDHKAKRTDYKFEVFPGGIEVNVFRDTYTLGIRPQAFAALVKRNPGYHRISEVQFFPNSRLDPEDPTDILVLKCLQQFPVYKLTFEGLREYEQHPNYWKLPVERVTIGSDGPLDVLEYHLFHNEHLKQLEIFTPTFDFMIKVTESWKQGKMVEVETTGKEIDDLAMIGYVKETAFKEVVSHYLSIYVDKSVNGFTRVLRLRARTWQELLSEV